MSNNTIIEELLSRLSYLDAFSNSKGILSSKGLKMIESTTNQSIVECITAIADTKRKLPNNPETKVILETVYDALLPFLGRIKIKELSQESSPKSNSNIEESFEDLYYQLNSLIGLHKVKDSVNNLITYHKIQKLRSQFSLKIPDRTLHLAFLGNPGTGKTSVARIIGKMYRQLGLLSKSHFIEVSRTDLIAGYQGQTALKVKQVIEKAKGGVLFIDEAYSLTENDHSDSYGRECLTELTKALEDYRNDLVVIVAGYTDLMKSFFDSNPGLKSRFNTFIEFNDYDSNELVEIFEQMSNRDDYKLSAEAKDKLYPIIQNEISNKNDKFANGRYVRNLYEDVVMNHARRLDSMASPSLYDLQCITLQDIPDIQTNTKT